MTRKFCLSRITLISDNIIHCWPNSLASVSIYVILNYIRLSTLKFYTWFALHLFVCMLLYVQLDTINSYKNCVPSTYDQENLIIFYVLSSLISRLQSVFDLLKRLRLFAKAETKELDYQIVISDSILSDVYANFLNIVFFCGSLGTRSFRGNSCKVVMHCVCWMVKLM